MNLKVICLNIWNGGKLFDNIQAFIKEENADILALQEVYNAVDYPLAEEQHMVGTLARLLGYEHYTFGPTCGKVIENGHRVQVGNAIFSKFPIKSTSSIFYDLPFNDLYEAKNGDFSDVPRCLQYAEIAIEGKILNMFNTQGIWGFDGDDTARRLNMGEIIAREVKGKKPALLMGDFNVQEGTKTTDKIDEVMTNIFKGERECSFNMKHKTNPGFASAIVDMMFVSPDIKTISHKTTLADVSDHLGLIGEFAIE